jgi:hypothetical protein
MTYSYMNVLCLCCCAVSTPQLSYFINIWPASGAIMYLSWGRREKRVGGAWASFTVYSSTVSSFSFLLRKRDASPSENFFRRWRLSRSLTWINVFVIHKISHIVTSCTFFISVVWNIKMLKRFYSNIQIINAVYEIVPVIIDERSYR